MSGEGLGHDLRVLRKHFSVQKGRVFYENLLTCTFCTFVSSPCILFLSSDHKLLVMEKGMMLKAENPARREETSKLSEKLVCAVRAEPPWVGLLNI